MVATIPQLIGKINPKLYAENGLELLKKYGSIDKIPAEEVKPKAIIYTPDSTNPKFFTEEGLEATHTIDHDTTAETVEAIYFFVLDLMNDFGLSVEKLVDNFTSTEGGTHFSEVGMKKTRMQEEASKMLANAGVVMRSVLQLVYDLKDFKIRLAHYDELKSKDPRQKEAAILALKQIWMDKVDFTQRGNSSIKAMAMGQAGFQTLIDAFLVAKEAKDVDKLDLNDRVKRILKPRIYEFNLWIKQSERELRKRYEMQKTYLRSQVNNLKLYARWAKPYLRAAQKLEGKEQGREPSLVNMFNTLRLELTLIGKTKLDIEKTALAGDLPKDFQKMKTKRDYYSCILVEFTVRGIPKQGVTVGRSEMSFKGYALNEDELKKLDYELQKSDIGDALTLIEGSTTESLEQMQADIDEFITEPEIKPEAPKDSSNPFKALIGGYNKKTSKKEEKSKPTDDIKKDVVVKPDNWIEEHHLRKVSAEEAAKTAFSLFDIYKKVHGMASYT